MEEPDRNLQTDIAHPNNLEQNSRSYNTEIVPRNTLHRPRNIWNEERRPIFTPAIRIYNGTNRKTLSFFLVLHGLWRNVKVRHGKPRYTKKQRIAPTLRGIRVVNEAPLEYIALLFLSMISDISRHFRHCRPNRFHTPETVSAMRREEYPSGRSDSTRTSESSPNSTPCSKRSASTAGSNLSSNSRFGSMRRRPTSSPL